MFAVHVDFSWVRRRSLANNEEEEEEDLKDSAIVKFCSSMIPFGRVRRINFWTTAKDGVTKIAAFVVSGGGD